MIPVKWSPHAASLLEEIVLGIATALYPDDGIRWEMKLREAADGLGNFPLSHPTIPVECYFGAPERISHSDHRANVDQGVKITCTPDRGRQFSCIDKPLPNRDTFRPPDLGDLRAHLLND